MKVTTNILISTYTGLLYCEMDEIYEVYRQLYQQSIYTHELSLLFESVRKMLREQHPWLPEVNLKKNMPDATFFAELNRIEALYGKEHEIKPHNFNKKEYCCEEMRDCLKAFKDISLSVGEGEISGSVSVDSEGVHISDGWNNLPEILFNYCPFCGKKLKETGENNKC